MSQTKQQEQDATPVKPRARGDWELFWRIIAGLMLMIIAWVVWVLYQISPRSVVTPMAYATQVKPIGTLNPASGAAVPAAQAAPQPAAEVKSADPAAGNVQDAVRAGAHQTSADVQAANTEAKQDQLQGSGLRLATEMSMPPTEKQSRQKPQEGKPGGAPAVPAATGAGAKHRP